MSRRLGQEGVGNMAGRTWQNMAELGRIWQTMAGRIRQNTVKHSNVAGASTVTA